MPEMQWQDWMGIANASLVETFKPANHHQTFPVSGCS
jgi:hypothetical protein